jgi:ABC-type transport system involved in cytochrome c biogenesis ATPase subunit
MNGSGKTTLLQKNYNIIQKHINTIYSHIKKMEKKKQKQAIINIYKLGIENIIYEKMENLSSGQKKKVLFNDLLINKQKIWIMDEPENFLDNITIEWIKKKSIEHINTNGMILITKKSIINTNNNIGLNGFEPLTFRLSSEHSTTES